jgi:phosphate transport system permease protein
VNTDFTQTELEQRKEAGKHPASLRSVASSGKKRMGDDLFKYVTIGVSSLVLVIILLVLYQLVTNSKLSIEKFGLGFITTSTWDPVAGIFGALPMIYGTVVSSFLGLLVALPLSLGVAVFLSELAPLFMRKWMITTFSFMVELLAAIPSIVYGLWGMFVLAPWLQRDIQPWLIAHLGSIPLFQGVPYGIGMMPAAIILAIMMIPIITSIARDVINMVPYTLKEGSLALGATRWEGIKLVLGTARSGILGAVILGLGRALGETMAVTLVIGNTPKISSSLLEPATTMASVLANEFTEATSDLYISSLIEVGLILFIITIVVNMLARFLVWRTSKNLVTQSR